MNYLQKHFPDYDCDECGNVYHNGVMIKPFNSNGYLQVLLFDADHKRCVTGVHVAVAMKYLPYYPGCVVHHKNMDKHDNNVSNLEVKDNATHSREHMMGKRLTAGRVPWNKGIKMSKEFCKKCSVSALRRHARERGEIIS